MFGSHGCMASSYTTPLRHTTRSFPDINWLVSSIVSSCSRCDEGAPHHLALGMPHDVCMCGSTFHSHSFDSLRCSASRSHMSTQRMVVFFHAYSFNVLWYKSWAHISTRTERFHRRSLKEGSSPRGARALHSTTIQ